MKVFVEALIAHSNGERVQVSRDGEVCGETTADHAARAAGLIYLDSEKAIARSRAMLER